jgi:hypothetical protein
MFENFDKESWLILILIILLCIVIVQVGFCMENFESVNNDTPTLLIFISKTCPHCVTYNEKTHPILEKALSNTNIKLKKIYADEDPDKLFEKYGVQYVPTFYCVKGDKKERVEQVDPKSLKDKFNSM